MPDNEIQKEIDLFASWPFSFSCQEVFDFVWQDINQEEFRDELSKDPRFIHVPSDPLDDERFISKHRLFEWFVNLNFRLYNAKVFRLNGHQLISLLSQLRKDGRWNALPSAMIDWVQSLGLIARGYEADSYVFPLARVLSFMKASHVFVVKELLGEINDGEICTKSMKKSLMQNLHAGLDAFDNKVARIIRARWGLWTDKPKTLENISKSLNLTRQRISQIEDIFWHKITSYPKVYNKYFLAAFLCDFFDRGGSLITRMDHKKMRIKRFILKCCGIPHIELFDFGIMIIGISWKKSDKFYKLDKIFHNETKSNNIVNILESKIKVSLSANDLKLLAEKIACYQLDHIGAAYGIYKALQTIGKPAHFSVITKVYNSLFPGKQKSERYVHGFLVKKNKKIVWIGIKGTYALKEWGYKRPSMTLFETVAKIVREKFRESKRPVPFTVIRAEIGKYRRFVMETSLIMATSFNPMLQSVKGNAFIPCNPLDSNRDELSIQKLDKSLKRFSREVRHHSMV